MLEAKALGQDQLQAASSRKSGVPSADQRVLKDAQTCIYIKLNIRQGQCEIALWWCDLQTSALTASLPFNSTMPAVSSPNLMFSYSKVR